MDINTLIMMIFFIILTIVIQIQIKYNSMKNEIMNYQKELVMLSGIRIDNQKFEEDIKFLIHIIQRCTKYNLTIDNAIKGIQGKKLVTDEIMQKTTKDIVSDVLEFLDQMENGYKKLLIVKYFGSSRNLETYIIRQVTIDSLEFYKQINKSVLSKQTDTITTTDI